MGANIKVHFFVADTPVGLLKKFNKYIYPEPLSARPNFASSLWKYGLHLCRRNGDPKVYLEDVNKMKESKLPYDSDCVDEMIMKTSFLLESGFDLSAATDKQLVLPVPVQILADPAPVQPCIVSTEGSTNCAIGKFNDKNVTFPDVFDSNYADWLKQKYDALSEFPKNAVYFHDISPKDESSNPCVVPSYIPKGLDISSLPCLTYWIPSRSTSMYNTHSAYGRKVLQEAFKTFSETSHIRSDIATVGMPKEVTFSGSKVSATWNGMQR